MRVSFGPIKSDQPQGTTWATNFPHTAWFDLSAYYITAFKTGSYPAITVRFSFLLIVPWITSAHRRMPSISGLGLIPQVQSPRGTVYRSQQVGTGLLYVPSLYLRL